MLKSIFDMWCWVCGWYTLGTVIGKIYNKIEDLYRKHKNVDGTNP